MKETLAAVREFMTIAEQVFPNRPNLPLHPVRELRKKLLKEEFEEYMEAEDEDDIVEVADALADIVYIVAGTALAYGIPLDKVFSEVHRSNMAKAVDGKLVYRNDGKVLKPTGWLPPDVYQTLKDAGWTPPAHLQIRDAIDAEILESLIEMEDAVSNGQDVG